MRADLDPCMSLLEPHPSGYSDVGLSGDVADVGMIQKRFRRASASHAGDYYQVLFEDGEDDSENAYVLLQRQFEWPDDDRYYVEASDTQLCGYFHIAAAYLSRTHLSLEFPSAPWTTLVIYYAADDRTYAEVRRTLRIMLGELLMLAQ